MRQEGAMMCRFIGYVVLAVLGLALIVLVLISTFRAGTVRPFKAEIARQRTNSGQGA